LGCADAASDGGSMRKATRMRAGILGRGILPVTWRRLAFHSARSGVQWSSRNSAAKFAIFPLEPQLMSLIIGLS
jgi:hypothetical protein